MTRRVDTLEATARALATAAGVDPDSRVAKAGGDRGMPAWCGFRDAARVHEAEALRAGAATRRPQDPRYVDSPLTVIGEHDEGTTRQMRSCMTVGNAVAGVICTDGHLGYAQPVGGVIAYEDRISISGFDIGCGNMAVRLDVPFAAVADRICDLVRHRPLQRRAGGARAFRRRRGLVGVRHGRLSRQRDGAARHGR